MDEVKAPAPETEALEEVRENLPATPPVNNSIWTDMTMMKTAYASAKLLASSTLVPEGTFRGNPGNCLIALEMATRLNMPPLAVMQNMYVVKGKPTWSGQACTAIVNGSGRFTPLDFVNLLKDDGTLNGMFARATRISDGAICDGPPVTWDMVKGEGWLDKNGSKWKTMPELMFGYRAAAFFARKYCPDLLCGLQTSEEVQDVKGWEQQKETTVITFD